MYRIWKGYFRSGPRLEKSVHHIDHVVVVAHHGNHAPLVERGARVRDAEAYQVTGREPSASASAEPQALVESQVGVLVVKFGDLTSGEVAPATPAPDGAQRHRQARVKADVAAARAEQGQPWLGAG